MIVADHALALAAAGKIDEAEAALAGAAPASYSMAFALLARSRAYVALRRGKPEQVADDAGGQTAPPAFGHNAAQWRRVQIDLSGDEELVNGAQR